MFCMLGSFQPLIKLKVMYGHVNFAIILAKKDKNRSIHFNYMFFKKIFYKIHIGQTSGGLILLNPKSLKV